MRPRLTDITRCCSSQTFTLVQPVRVRAKLDDSSAPPLALDLLLGQPLWSPDGPAAEYTFLRKSFELTAAPSHAVLDITAQPTWSSQGDAGNMPKLLGACVL